MKSLITIAMLLMFAGSALGDDKPTDQQALQGRWKVTSVIEDGKAIKEAEGTTFTFEESKFIGRSKQRTRPGTFKIDPEKSPKHMDFTISRNGKDETMSMIYKLKENQLTICSPQKHGDPRPKKFGADAGSNQTLIVMKKMGNKTE